MPGDKGAWRNSLVKTRGSYAACHSNIISILANEPDWAGVLAYDEFIGQIVKAKPPPWKDHDRPSGDLTGPWGGADATRAAAWITREWEDIKAPEAMVEAAVRVVADRNRVHPVKDWLSGLIWDSVNRLDTWLIDLAGADDSPYTRTVGPMFLISAVARTFEPGCKVDHTLVLEGKTGKGKSALLRELTGEAWFLETEMELGSKDFFQTLRGKLIVELAELDSLSRGELARVKAVLTKRVDTYRESYGRHRHDYPRQCVFTGTTEEDTYLKDEKGNRRFWPVKTGNILVPEMTRQRAQLWAEATARYRKGERWHVTDRALQGLFEDEQEWRRQHDPWEAAVGKWLVKNPRRWGDGVTTTDMLTRAIDIPQKDQGRLEQMRVGAVLKKLGWDRKQERVAWGGREYIYRPTPEVLARLKGETVPVGAVAHMSDYKPKKDV